MIPNILLPRVFKWIGLLLLLFGYTYAFTYKHDFDDVTQVGGIVIQVSILAGLLMIAGAKEKTEDEMISHGRLTSLQWSVFIIIALRLLFKCVAFILHDVRWLPKWQVNSLLLFYLGLFYYQLYIMEYVIKLFKRGSGK